MTNDGGGIVDDLLVYRIEFNTYMLVVNASNINKDWLWIKSKNILKAEMLDISNETSMLSIQGPKAKDVIEKLTEIDLDNIPYYHFKKGEIAGVKNIIISATGYTGAGGYEIYVEKDSVEKVWNMIFDKDYRVRNKAYWTRCKRYA